MLNHDYDRVVRVAESLTEMTSDFRREKQREALDELISLMKTPRTSAEWSVDRVIELVRLAHDAGLSPDFIAAEAHMSINDVLSFLALPPEPERPYDWMIVHINPPQNRGRHH